MHQELGSNAKHMFQVLFHLFLMTFIKYLFKIPVILNIQNAQKIKQFLVPKKKRKRTQLNQ